MYLCLNRIRKETEAVIGETRKGSGVSSDLDHFAARGAPARSPPLCLHLAPSPLIAPHTAIDPAHVHT